MDVDTGTATWAVAAVGITMAGAEAAITVGDTQRADEPDRVSWKPPRLAASSFMAAPFSSGIPCPGEPLAQIASISLLSQGAP